MKQKKQETTQVQFPLQYKVCAADLSLRRPGWCILNIESGKILETVFFSLDNKGKKKTHGQILNEIYQLFYDSVISNLNTSNWYFVRETMVMNKKVPSERNVAKVVGFMDFILGDIEWFEIYPVTVKKIIAGSGKAEKSEVAEALEKYIGKQKYKCDDESDAAAVGIAWLIQQHQVKEKKDE